MGTRRTILTPAQRALLVAVGQSELGRRVYFTGGTLLACHYLHHRRSLDLDFFSDDLLDDLLVARAMQGVAGVVGATAVRYQRYPNRWQYLVTIGHEDVKVEFTYFPFPALGRRPALSGYGVTVDSLRDIAVNKVHAAFEREAPRDTFDLYIIMRRKEWKLTELLHDVDRKFGVIIDPVHLLGRLLVAAGRLNEVRPLYLGHGPQSQAVQSFFEGIGHRILRRRLRSRY